MFRRLPRSGDAPFGWPTPWWCSSSAAACSRKTGTPPTALDASDPQAAASPGCWASAGSWHHPWCLGHKQDRLACQKAGQAGSGVAPLRTTAHRDGYNRAWYLLYAAITAQLGCALFKQWFISFRVLTTYLPVNALVYATHVRVSLLAAAAAGHAWQLCVLSNAAPHCMQVQLICQGRQTTNWRAVSLCCAGHIGRPHGEAGGGALAEAGV